MTKDYYVKVLGNEELRSYIERAAGAWEVDRGEKSEYQDIALRRIGWERDGTSIKKLIQIAGNVMEKAFCVNENARKQQRRDLRQIIESGPVEDDYSEESFA